ncbi:MAG: aminotransferase class I/II-fold pyridoxal phosphate-dependent enzyme [Bacteroidota bacterium]|nr:aminotransferase class I/II-fold pyridoxal phosphate-dependent enzyme [Bacteroidota bacterium]
MTDELFSNYIGPKGENIDALKRLMNIVLDFHAEWRRSFYKEDRTVFEVSEGYIKKMEDELKKFLERSRSSLPYFHPRYAAQMVKDPPIPAVLAYISFMLSNPNNHAYEGGPVTTEMEMETIDLMVKFAGLEEGWGHLTSGGSLANMEALWAARDFYEGGTVCFSEVSHYSWKRICKILGIKDFREIAVDKYFRMDLNALEDELKKNKAMFVMANLGSTGSGSVDNIEGLLELRRKYGFHLHIDAAYGGFIRSAILSEDYSVLPYSSQMSLKEYTYRQLALLGQADSITIDPHKHGMLSYGAGAVLYKNEALRDVLLNTAPYTYHKKDKPNIGMFSLEGSRPGAMAAACWLTYKMLPPNILGAGKLIRQSLASSREFYEMLEKTDSFKNLNDPDLDINCFYRNSTEKTIEALNKNTLAIYNRLSVETADPEYIISKFVLPPSIAKTVLPDYSNNSKENFSALRTVFMKHWSAENDFYYIKELIGALEKE